jgi:hypothetical protein
VHILIPAKKLHYQSIRPANQSCPILIPSAAGSAHQINAAQKIVSPADHGSRTRVEHSQKDLEIAKTYGDLSG